MKGGGSGLGTGLTKPRSTANVVVSQSDLYLPHFAVKHHSSTVVGRSPAVARPDSRLTSSLPLARRVSLPAWRRIVEAFPGAKGYMQGEAVRTPLP